MRSIARISAALLFALPGLANAQTIGNSVVFPAGFAPGMSICIKQADGTCVPVSTTVPIPSASIPKAASSTSTSGSVTTASTFQSALASSATRLGCTIQNTSAATMQIYVGPIASAAVAAALQIPPGGTFGCVSGGIVLTDQISVTSSTAGATYVVVAQ